MTDSPAASTAAASDAGTFADPDYVAAVVDILGVIAYGEITAFERLVDDAKLAPTLRDKLDLASMAAKEFGHVQPLLDRIAALGHDPVAVVEEFAAPFDAFHAHTAPRDWLEGLVKAYVGDGLAADFYREIARFLDADTRDLITESLEESGQSAFVVARVREAIEADPRVAGRLALWGRRLMGEALTQAQRVAAERDSMTTLLAGTFDQPGVSSLDLASLGKMFTRLTEAHAARMDELGLES